MTDVNDNAVPRLYIKPETTNQFCMSSTPSSNIQQETQSPPPQMVILIFCTTKQHKLPLTQTMYLWVAHVDPVEYLVRVCTLAPAQLVRGRHSGHGYQRLEQNAHTIVDGVRGTHCRVAAVHT